MHVEYPTQPGHRGLISRSKDGRFILDDEEDDEDDDDGGFGVSLPPNRFRTRSVAIVAGYSPERLYSNMPPGAFVVESGVYKVGADREWERPEPIYWRQVVYGARGASSDGSGTLPRPQAMQHQARLLQQPQVVAHQHYLPPPQAAVARQVGRLGEEDLRRLRAMESTSSLDQQASAAGFDHTSSTSRLIRTSNLELVRPASGAASSSTSKLRSSSPLNQLQAPLQAPPWASPIGQQGEPGSELSSITHRERSLPSTLLTTTSTLPNLTSENTTASTRSLRAAQQRSSELQTIPEHHQEEPPPAYSQQQQQQLQQQQQQYRRGKSTHQQEDPYFQRPTYLNADAMFPNYALNYPAPIHHSHGGTISPSRQYPPVQVPPDSYWQSLYVQPDPRDFYYYNQQQLASSPPPSYTSPTHDYENTRYLTTSSQQQQRRQRQQQQQPDETGGPPLPAPRRRPRTVSVEAAGMRRHRESTVIDGRLVQSAATAAAAVPAGGTAEDQTSLVSEVLDAEVTALTNSSSSPGSDKGSPDKSKSKSKTRLQEVKERLTAAAAAGGTAVSADGSQQQQDSTSSGIASKNTSQHQTSSSSGGSQQQQQQQQQQEFLSPDSKAPLEPIFERHPQPFYENWPPSKQQQQQQQQQQQHPPEEQHLHVGAAHYHGYHYLQPLSIATGDGGDGYGGDSLQQPQLPPLTPHETSGMAAKPQTAAAAARRFAAAAAADGATRLPSPPHGEDTASLDTPPSRGGGAASAAANVDLGSRPGSAHSAPMLDVSIDRHYEFDTRTPTDDLLAASAVDPDDIRHALPRQWNRPYLG